MNREKVKRSAVDAGRFVAGCLMPRHPVLATAKVAGRATRVGTDSAATVSRAALRTITWSQRRLLGSVKFLNPLVWTGRLTARRAPAPPKRTVSKQAAHPAKTPGVAGARPTAAKPQRQPVKTPPAPAVAARRVAVPPKVTKPKVTRPKVTRSKVTRSKVTQQMVTEAVFPEATEKVIFAKALKDLSSTSTATRARAAEMLGGIDHELSAIALTWRIARDACTEVRKECVNALTTLSRKEGLPAVERALSDKDSAVRLAAVRGVYRLAGVQGAALLVGMFNDPNEDVRRRAVACLGWLGQAHLAVELLPLLRGGSESVRLAALGALGNLKSPAVIDQVISLLNDPDQAVQRKAFDVLQTITGRQMSETFPEDDAGRRFVIARWRAWREEHP